MYTKVRGGKVTTSVPNQNIIDTIEGIDIRLTNVSIKNLSETEINVIINGGSKIPIEVNETLNLGDLEVDTLVVVEQGSTVKYLGL